MATVFRQIAMNRFEVEIHTARRKHGELSADAFAKYWISTQSAMFGDSVTLTDNYRRWWSYIPHFLHTPGYVYAYAFGELLVSWPCMPAIWRLQMHFLVSTLSLCGRAGSDWPHKLVACMGVDLQDPGFWHQGLNAIETLIERAEAVYEECQQVSR